MAATSATDTVNAISAAEAGVPPWRLHILRAAYLLRAEKRVVPLTPVRARPRLRLQPGVPAA